MSDLIHSPASVGTITTRHDLLQKRVESMIGTPGYFGTIISQSGLGKTFCAAHLYNLLLRNEVHDDQIVFYECIETDNGNVALEKLEALVDAHLRPTKGAAIKAFISGGVGKNLLAFGTGILKDFAEKYNLKNTTDAVTEALGTTLVDISSKQTAGNRLGERLIKLRNSISRSGQRYFIVIDAVEKMADPGLRFLTELSKRPHSNVRCLIFVDNGWTGSLQLKELKASLQTGHMPAIGELHGLSSREIKSWFQSIHQKELSDEDANRVFVDSDSGQPSIIKAWLTTGSDDIGRVVDHSRAAWGKIMLKVDALPAASHKVLSILACAYPQDLALHNVEMVASIAGPDLMNAVAGLRAVGDLIKETPEGIKCASRNLADCMKNNIGDQSVKYCRGLLLDSAFGNDGKHKALPPKIMENLSSSLLAANNNDPSAIETVLNSVESSLEGGAFRLAETILSSIESLPNNAVANWSDSNRVHQARLRADLAGQFGEYEQAIDWARRGLAANPNAIQSISLQLSIGDKLLQLGKHQAAKASFRDVRIAAKNLDDAEQYIIALVRTVKALFDIEKYGSCIRLMMFIEKKAATIAISDKTRCLYNRWLARVFARSESLWPEAIFHAQSALEIAKRMNQGRQIGNCRFVLGEVNRYQGLFNEALLEYKMSLDYARNSGNKDLEIYSSIGIALTYAGLSDWPSFDLSLDDLKSCMTVSASIEELYIHLLISINDFHKNNLIGSGDIMAHVESLRKHSKDSLADWLLNINSTSGPMIQNLSERNWKLFVL